METPGFSLKTTKAIWNLSEHETYFLTQLGRITSLPVEPALGSLFSHHCHRRTWFQINSISENLLYGTRAEPLLHYDSDEEKGLNTHCSFNPLGTFNEGETRHPAHLERAKLRWMGGVGHLLTWAKLRWGRVRLVYFLRPKYGGRKWTRHLLTWAEGGGR
ncbi:hypothetical protein AVEN_119617-1 [Araneus ventricosus]|uniref:Uncharacterized protein n=1 Tax=Araneus ventricosus TaxID=182803 RepID=A0A4Y2RJM2_ARAVE|nr:hypothetical protein AVEN_119617-1 [Araneus ventricosus]